MAYAASLRGTWQSTRSQRSPVHSFPRSFMHFIIHSIKNILYRSFICSSNYSLSHSFIEATNINPLIRLHLFPSFTHPPLHPSQAIVKFVIRTKLSQINILKRKNSAMLYSFDLFYSFYLLSFSIHSI